MAESRALKERDGIRLTSPLSLQEPRCNLSISPVGEWTDYTHTHTHSCALAVGCVALHVR